MKQSHFNEEQIILALRKQESKEKTTAEVCRDLGISQATFFKWKKKYGGMNVSEARRLRELEQENTRCGRSNQHGLGLGITKPPDESPNPGADRPKEFTAPRIGGNAANPATSQ
jgi:putative transposase